MVDERRKRLEKIVVVAEDEGSDIVMGAIHFHTAVQSPQPGRFLKQHHIEPPVGGEFAGEDTPGDPAAQNRDAFIVSFGVLDLTHSILTACYPAGYAGWNSFPFSVFWS